MSWALYEIHSTLERNIFDICLLNILTTLWLAIGPCARSDWSKSHVLSEYKTMIEKACFIVFRYNISVYHKASEEAQAVYYIRI